MTAFVFVATFVPKIPIPFALGRRGNFFSGDVLRAANWNFKRNNRLGIGGFFKRLSDMDYTDDFNQGGGSRNILATARKKFPACADNFVAFDDGGLHVDGRGSLRQFERGACVDAGTFAQSGGKYFRRDNFKRGDKKSRW